MSENLLEVERPYWTQGERNENWPLNKHSQAYAASLIVKTGPGKLYGFTVYNSGAAQFIQVHDTTTVPASGAIPAAVINIAATDTRGVYYGDTGRAFNTGCVLVNSSTGPTFTAGSADCFFDAQFL